MPLPGKKDTQRNFFFSKWGEYHPSFCIQEMHTVFLLNYLQHLKRAIQKINLEATSLNLQWDEGDNINSHHPKNQMSSQDA
jgi:hypothetical protein